MYAMLSDFHFARILLENLMNPMSCEIALSSGEKRIAGRLSHGKIRLEEFGGMGKQRFDATASSLETMDKNRLPIEVHVRKLDERGFGDSQAVTINGS